MTVYFSPINAYLQENMGQDSKASRYNPHTPTESLQIPLPYLRGLDTTWPRFKIGTIQHDFSNSFLLSIFSFSSQKKKMGVMVSRCYMASWVNSPKLDDTLKCYCIRTYILCETHNTGLTKNVHGRKGHCIRQGENVHGKECSSFFKNVSMSGSMLC